MVEGERGWQPRAARPLWIIALVFYVVGDILTTTAGLSLGAVERNPVVGSLVEEYVLLSMIPLKLGTCGLCYGLWHFLSNEYRVLIPAILAIVGILVTAWNLRIIGILL